MISRMKRAATHTSSPRSKKRQASLASYLKPKTESPVPLPRTIELVDDSRDVKLESTGNNKPKSDPQASILDSYPPPDHPSYHLPPSPSYNHPFSISPPPPALLESLAFTPQTRTITKPDLGLDLLYLKHFVSPACSRALMAYLLSALPWYRVTYMVRGIRINTPRFTTVFGKDSTNTPWDGYKVSPRAIPPILLRLMQKVEQVTDQTYNFTLVNYYASGSDSISYHSDSESFLGPNPCIASLSLGGTRDFHLRHVKYKDNGAPAEKFVLADGDMVVMRGRTQHDWQHAVPKRAKAEGRINITFRKGVVPYATKNYLDYNVGSGPLYRWVNGEMVEQK